MWAIEASDCRVSQLFLFCEWPGGKKKMNCGDGEKKIARQRVGKTGKLL